MRELAASDGDEPSTDGALTVLPSTAVSPDPEFVEDPISAQSAERIQRILGITPERWERLMPKSRGGIPRFALKKITARLSLNIGSDNVAKLSETIAMLRDIMEDPKTPTDTRVTAGKAMAIAVEAMSKAFPQLMYLADEGGDRTAQDDKNNGSGNKPKNLPPMLNVQVNVNGAQGGQQTYPVGAVVKSGRTSPLPPASK